MKILIFANNDVGLYQFRKELIEELLKTNEVTIALPYGELVEPLKVMGCKFVDTPLERRGMNPFKDIQLLKKYRTIIKKEQPDRVITYTIKPNIYGGLASRLLKIPYLVNITGLGTAFQKEGLFRKLVSLMYKTGLKKAKTVFFENAENMQIFLEENIVRKDQVCLLNGAGVNLEHYQVLDYPFGNQTKFLYIGRIMREKGIDEMIGAMKRLVDEGIQCTLDVVGSYEEDKRDIMERCEAEGWLHYHGYQKDVRPFIAASHCFVLPSWHEGMANTNLECAAMGRPLITSNIHGCKEAVIDGKSGFLCEKQNVDSLYDVMKKFVELSYEERKAMGLSGRKHVEKVFDKKKVVEETIKEIMKKC